MSKFGSEAPVPNPSLERSAKRHRRLVPVAQCAAAPAQLCRCYEALLPSLSQALVLLANEH